MVPPSDDRLAAKQWNLNIQDQDDQGQKSDRQLGMRLETDAASELGDNRSSKHQLDRVAS